jgi:hypothetical protein
MGSNLFKEFQNHVIISSFFNFFTSLDLFILNHTSEHKVDDIDCSRYIMVLTIILQNIFYSLKLTEIKYQNASTGCPFSPT